MVIVIGNYGYSLINLIICSRVYIIDNNIKDNINVSRLNRGSLIDHLSRNQSQSINEEYEF